MVQKLKSYVRQALILHWPLVWYHPPMSDLPVTFRKSLRLQLRDKYKLDLHVQKASAPGKRLLPKQSVPYKIETKDPAEMRDVLLNSFAEEK